MYNLKGKVAIVTGGSRDIGRQVSLKLAAAGAQVCINYLNNKSLADETLKMVKDAGGNAIAVQGDVKKLIGCCAVNDKPIKSSNMVVSNRIIKISTVSFKLSGEICSAIDLHALSINK